MILEELEILKQIKSKEIHDIAKIDEEKYRKEMELKALNEDVIKHRIYLEDLKNRIDEGRKRMEATSAAAAAAATDRDIQVRTYRRPQNFWVNGDKCFFY